MAKAKGSDWINENVPDAAVWGQYYVIARKEEYQSGTKVQTKQTVHPARDATITGKEIKEHLKLSASSSLGFGLIIAGVVLAAIAFLLKEPMGSSTGYLVFMMLICLGMVIGGVYFLIKARKQASELQQASSWEQLYPYIEEALTEKVFTEEQAKRKAEMGDKGAYQAGYYCLPARLALQGQFDKAKSSFSLAEGLKGSLKQAAAGVPEDGLALTRR
ncbi:MAG: hypothetical protein IJJ99_09835 [Oscillospiraceae bacterium]|nr:hypothetical protein [Oscillospiraceae bacterium]